MIDRAALTTEVNQIEYHRGTTSWIRFFNSLDNILVLDDRYEDEAHQNIDTGYTVEEIQDETDALERHKSRLQRYNKYRKNDIQDGEFDILENIITIIRDTF